MTSSEGEVDKQSTKNKSSKNRIEVERKFVVGDDCERRITELGGTLLGEVFFRDDYFDTADYKLTLSDFWLRRRNGIWELKFPPSSRDEGNVFCRQYCETNKVDNIVDLVSKATGLLESERATNVDDLVASNLTKFASIKSNRRSYLLDGVRIDLDTTDFGFRIGELEICVDAVQDVSGAVTKIERLANTLGLKPFSTYGLLTNLIE